MREDPTDGKNSCRRKGRHDAQARAERVRSTEDNMESVGPLQPLDPRVCRACKLRCPEGRK